MVRCGLARLGFLFSSWAGARACGYFVCIMVKPPALYRSPLFSLGLFVLAFLVWTCADSWESWTRCFRQVTLHNGKATAGLAGDGAAIYGGKIVLSWTSATMRPAGVTLSRESFIYARSPMPLSGARFAMPALQKHEDELPSWRMIIRREAEIPMW